MKIFFYAVFVFLFLLSCQSKISYDFDYAKLLPQDSELLLRLNLDENSADFFLEGIFKPFFGSEDWVKTLVKESTTVLIGVNAQRKLSALVVTPYSRLLLDIGLSSHPMWQSNEKHIFLSQELGYTLDISHQDYLYFSQQSLEKPRFIDLADDFSPWPQGRFKETLEHSMSLYSWQPLILLEDLPLALDTIMSLSARLDISKDGSVLSFSALAPSETRATALMMSLRFILPPVLLRSKSTVLKEQARNFLLEQDGENIFLQLELDELAISELVHYLLQV